MIIVDLPPKDNELCLPAPNGFEFHPLATPTTDEKRLPPCSRTRRLCLLRLDRRHHRLRQAISAQGRGFGPARHTKLPVAVGFGVRTAKDARAIAENADAVVVGSALVNALKGSLDRKGKATARTVKAVTKLVAELAKGVRGAGPKI